MTIESKIVLDSIGPNDARITTFLLKYPRFIHSEFMTHRAFSRNASSSRAIPFNRQMQMIKDDLAKPLSFRLNQKGMQAGDDLEDQQIPEQIWKAASEEAIRFAEKLADLGVHKQYVNRLVEPFAHITVVVTATEFANFFALRHHSMAQPEIAELAKIMWDQYSTNKPQVLKSGEWHLPFVSQEEIEDHHVHLACMEIPGTFENAWLPLIKSSVARCARTSYLNHDGSKPNAEADYLLYDRLLKDQPIHASPAEHQAKATMMDHFSGNLFGWLQFRKTLEGENITKFEGPIG